MSHMICVFVYIYICVCGWVIVFVYIYIYIYIYISNNAKLVLYIYIYIYTNLALFCLLYLYISIFSESIQSTYSLSYNVTKSPTDPISISVLLSSSGAIKNLTLFHSLSSNCSFLASSCRLSLNGKLVASLDQNEAIVKVKKKKKKKKKNALNCILFCNDQNSKIERKVAWLQFEFYQRVDQRRKKRKEVNNPEGKKLDERKETLERILGNEVQVFPHNLFSA